MKGRNYFNFKKTHKSVLNKIIFLKRIFQSQPSKEPLQKLGIKNNRRKLFRLSTKQPNPRYTKLKVDFIFLKKIFAQITTTCRISLP